MKHNPMATANAAGVVTAGAFVVCRLLVSLFPVMMFNLAQSWFHGMELGRYSAAGMKLALFVPGLLTITLSAWLVGYFFAVAYNYFDKK